VVGGVRHGYQPTEGPSRRPRRYRILTWRVPLG
jgi:hypothetical protein